MRVGVDMGGTFTDLVAVDEEGRLTIDKVSSSPDPSILVDALARAGATPERLDFLGIGTTVGTNALIERAGARTALITTRGFRDLLEIRRADREELYDLQWDLPAPLIPRRNRLEVTERMSWRGEPLVALAEDEVGSLVRILGKRAIESVAIVLLHAYVNPANERRLRDLLAAGLPELEISISSDVLPTYREFERTSTVAVNAYLAPVLRRYFDALGVCLQRAGYRQDVLVMQSNGGLGSLSSASRTPARLVRSGPSAGCVALQQLASVLAMPDVIGLDIGGTSADVSIVRNGRATLSDRNVPEWGMPVLLPSIDIASIGAGGGSLARVDVGGALRVGPESAGAYPGPACYGRGGLRPTSTDAQLVLGRLGPDQLVGGEFPIQPALAEAAIVRDVGGPLGLELMAAAAGVLRVITDTMMRAVRLATVERGHDPRDFALCGFGGNGPLYAVDIARELSIPTVVVPRHPGVFSAYGVLHADVVYDASQTLLVDVDAGAAELLERQAQELRARVVAEFRDAGIVDSELAFRYVAELRYRSQLHELAVDVASPGFAPGVIARLLGDFHALHAETFGHSEPGDPVTLVNLKVLGTRRRAVRSARTDEARDVEDTVRPVYFDGHGHLDTPVVNRARLRPGAVISGPALITQTDSTCLLPPGSRASVAPSDDLIIVVAV